MEKCTTALFLLENNLILFYRYESTEWRISLGGHLTITTPPAAGMIRSKV